MIKYLVNELRYQVAVARYKFSDRCLCREFALRYCSYRLEEYFFPFNGWEAVGMAKTIIHGRWAVADRLVRELAAEGYAEPRREYMKFLAKIPEARNELEMEFGAWKPRQ